MSTAKRNSSLLSLLVSAAIIAFALAGWQMLLHAPLAWQVSAVHVAAGARPVSLGQRELGQHAGSPRSAERNHIRLSQHDGQWWIANIAANKRLDAPSANQSTRFLKRWRLAPGDTITVGPQTLTVASIDDLSLTLMNANSERAEWRNGHLDTGEPAYSGCPRQGSPWWHHYLSPWRAHELKLFSIGGQVHCPRRWPLPGLPVDSLRVNWVLGSFQIAPGSADVSISITGIGEHQPRGFEDLELPIGDDEQEVQRIVAGRSGYQLTNHGAALTLTPQGGTDLWPENSTRPIPRDPRVSVDYQLLRWAGDGPTPLRWFQQHPWWPLLAILLSGLALLSHSRALRRRKPAPGGGMRPLSVLGLVLALGLWLQPAIDLRWLYWCGWLGWAWSSLIALETHRLRGIGGWLWLCALLLAGTGALVLGQLAAGGDSSRWLHFTLGHWGLWSVAGWGLGLIAAASPFTTRALLIALFTSRNGFWSTLRLLVPLLLAVALLLQLAFGREQGLAGIQPVEAAKLMLVLLLAFTGMRLMLLRQVRGNAYRGNRIAFILRIVGLALLFWLFADALLWAVHDMSPVLILALLVVAWLWKIAPAPDQQRSIGGLALRLVVLLAVVGAVLLAGLGYLHPDSIPEWLPQYDRLQVWANPAAHPHSGMQVLSAMAFVGSGGQLGALPHWWGSNGQAGIMSLPAVQDDFISAFMLYRFGAIPGLVLLAVQLLMLGLLFQLSGQVSRHWIGTERLAGQGVSLTLFGLAWLFAAHWLIAWANVLGLLPVMGQPMTWLAAGNSHLLLFAYPALTLVLLVAWARD